MIWVLKQRLQFQVFSSSILSLTSFSLARQCNCEVVSHFQSAADKCSGKTASQAVEIFSLMTTVEMEDEIKIRQPDVLLEWLHTMKMLRDLVSQHWAGG